MTDKRYHCPKCENGQFETKELRAAGGFWTKIFNIQSRKFTTLTCTRCKYTEIYETDTHTTFVIPPTLQPQHQKLLSRIGVETSIFHRLTTCNYSKLYDVVTK